MSNRICYFCGCEATTNEHVPPKGFFPRESRLNLIKVPSCVIHNTQKSGDDEYIRMVIVGAAWDNSPNLTKETILRSVKRKPLLAKKILDNCVKEENGTHHYDAEATRLYKGLEAIARGIIFYEHHVVHKEPPKFIITNYLSLIDSAPTELSNGTYAFAQEVASNLLFEWPEKGCNKDIFKYKHTERHVQFTFYQTLINTVVF